MSQPATTNVQRPISGNYSLGISLSLMAFFSFSATDAIAKLLTQGMSPAVFTICAASLATPLLLGFYWLRGEEIVLKPNLPHLTLFRAITGGTTALCAFTAFQRLPLAEAYVFIFTVPMIITALSVVILKEKVGWRRWTAVIVGFIGVMIAFRPGVSEPQIGHLMAFGCAFFGSIGLITMRQIGQREKRSTLSLWVIIGNVLLPLPFALMDTAGWQSIAWRELGLLVMAATGFAFSQVAMISATRAISASQIAPFQYSQIIWGVALGWLLFSDWPSLFVWLGLVLIVGSGLYTWHREMTLQRAQR